MFLKQKPQRLKTKCLILLSQLQTNITNLSTKSALNTKATKIETKIPDTAGFITTSEFKRLAKMSFNAIMKEEVKSIANKTQVDTALDIVDNNKEKVRRRLI